MILRPCGRAADLGAKVSVFLEDSSKILRQFPEEYWKILGLQTTHTPDWRRIKTGERKRSGKSFRGARKEGTPTGSEKQKEK